MPFRWPHFQTVIIKVRCLSYHDLTVYSIVVGDCECLLLFSYLFFAEAFSKFVFVYLTLFLMDAHIFSASIVYFWHS